jgi:hypothetical protein
MIYPLQIAPNALQFARQYAHRLGCLIRSPRGGNRPYIASLIGFSRAIHKRIRLGPHCSEYSASRHVIASITAR